MAGLTYDGAATYDLDDWTTGGPRRRTRRFICQRTVLKSWPRRWREKAMAVLFRLERNPKFKGSDPPAGSDFGWRWIEVVAIEPRAIAGPEPQDAEGWREFRHREDR